MNINSVFPSKYLKAADLQGRDVMVTIERVTLEDLAGNGDDKDVKPVVYFKGKTSGLGLNKTNANTIADLYGPETDNWIGRAITLFPTHTDFNGRQVECIRVRVQAPNGAMPVQPAPAPAPVAAPPQQHQPISEDDIPF